MKRKSILIIISFLLIIIGNIFAFRSIREDYRNNTYFILAVDTTNGTEQDVKWIDEHYNFWQLKLENNKLKYDVGLKMLWTLDALLLLTVFSLLKQQQK
ncbi:MAG: hypothetical protein WC582_00900 [Patescibacteria group bacterium]|jgi:uncharacterized protein YxeA